MQADVAEMQATRAPDMARTRSGMPRLRTLGDLDGRTAAARRFRELVSDYSSDLGGDLTTAQQAIVQRVVSLQVWCEGAEASYAESGELDISTFTTATNAMRRLLADIGLERRPKDVTPNLRDYLASLGPEPGVDESVQSDSPAEPAAGAATGEAANESEPHTECAGLNGHPAQPAGAAPHDAVAHSADCASVPASSADGGEHG
jgi:hypothetical protein